MKTFCTIILILFASVAAVAQTATFTAVEHTQQRWILVTIEWTADGSGAVSEDFDVDIPELPNDLAGRVCARAETIPGTGTPPTALYDIVITTPGGVDVFKTALADRSATVAEDAPPLVGDVSTNFYAGFAPVGFDSSLAGEVWTFSVTNAGAGGEGTLRLFFR